jgi:hypothetical protein
MDDGVKAAKWARVGEDGYMMSLSNTYDHSVAQAIFRASYDPKGSGPSTQWRIIELENALAFYANAANWDAGPRGSFEETKIFNDCGDVAKKALLKK